MISTKNTSLFKRCLESISPLIQETNVRFKDDGIYIKSIDKTQIILVDFYMPKKCFDSYSVEPNLVGLNIQELYNMLSRSFDQDKLQLDLKDTYLDVFLSGQIQRRFSLSYLDLSENDIKIPEINFDATFTISAYLLKEILKDASLIGTTITFKVESGKFIVESKGDKGQLETIVPEVKAKSKKNIISKFSLAFLKNMTKAIDNETELTIKLSDDTPLYLGYTLGDKVEVKFYLSSMLI